MTHQNFICQIHNIFLWNWNAIFFERDGYFERYLFLSRNLEDLHAVLNFFSFSFFAKYNNEEGVAKLLFFKVSVSKIWQLSF